METTAQSAPSRGDDRVPSGAIDDRALLEAVATGSIRPADAIPLMREYLRRAEDPDAAAEAAYEALRELVWTCVRGREDGEWTDPWGDLVLRTRALMRKRTPLVAERLTALGDLMARSGRAEVPAQAWKARRRILEALGNRDDAGISALVEATGIKRFTLARLVTNLAREGIVSRRHAGDGVVVRLTAMGRAERDRAPQSVEVAEASLSPGLSESLMPP